MKPVHVDFSVYSDEVLKACYLRINPEKFPENFAAAQAEIIKRNLSIPVASETESSDYGFFEFLNDYESLIKILDPLN